MNEVRHILLPNVYNFRDLGGYATEDGKVTKWGKIYRTDNLSELTKEGWDKLKELGVDLLIDLRGAAEQKKNPVNPAYPLTFRTFALIKQSASKPEPVSEAASKEFVKSMELNYSDVLFTNLGCACELLDTILDELVSGRGSTAFMCTAGKDRTGITAAIILYLCGVEREDIIADYMVSNIYNSRGINKRMRNLPDGLAEALPDLSVLDASLASDPKTMQAFLDDFEKEDIRQKLADNGFGLDKQEELKNQMTC